ncbi:hypothetical protein PARHAE_03272 [Paracoccus haematequi]|uniref:Uncharacterized protein n=1 Tax=Paracoccus haematequi TaxID=2491866 RepID=A0A3S4CL59_9RHOB|nr:hypothetical protein [Paracoccus haematequi]VDS10061.1 hypothetical protein PARHAE_03272 [Paracoccus haematequi]
MDNTPRTLTPSQMKAIQRLQYLMEQPSLEDYRRRAGIFAYQDRAAAREARRAASKAERKARMALVR